MAAHATALNDLVLAAQSGDRAAMEQLLAAAQPDIRRYARMSCRHASDIDDAVQDALWLVYRRVGTLRVVTSFSGWLMMVVRRECSRLARRAMGRSDEIETIANDARFAARPVDELRLDLAAAIHSLPDHYRAIIIMRDVEECTIDEIGRSQNLTREAVKARLHRARGLVREYMKD